MSRERELPDRRLLLKNALAAGALTALPATVAQAATPPAPTSRSAASRPAYVNPLVRNRAAPHINRHTDGFYSFTATAPEYDRIILRRSRTLRGLSTAAESVAWRKRETGAMGAHIWAPEIHRIHGKWYICFASAPTDARQYKDIVGDPLNDPNRHTRIQRLSWKPDGTPDFGVPVADTASRTPGKES